jgi:hypothetical protein
MGRKKKDIIDEIEERVNETINLMMLDKTMQCDPSRSDYARCVVKRGMIHVELRKRRDKIVRQLAFEHVTGSIDEKEIIESIINGLIQIGLVTENEWMKAISDALRYLNRINGVDARERVRRMAEEMDKIFEEEGFR